MKNKKIKWFIFTFLILTTFITIISIYMTKKIKIGNTMSSQEIVDKILNLNSYKAKIYVQINSNKNQNKYILEQEYNTENGNIQIVIEPENIAGIKIYKKENNLTIENSNLNLQTIFENYKGLEDNSLDLNTFVKEYKENSNSKYEEKNEEIIMKTKIENSKYLKNKILYIDKEKKIPTKLLIQDNNQNSTVIIEYNEIELN